MKDSSLLVVVALAAWYFFIRDKRTAWEKSAGLDAGSEAAYFKKTGKLPY